MMRPRPPCPPTRAGAPAPLTRVRRTQHPYEQEVSRPTPASARSQMSSAGAISVAKTCRCSATCSERRCGASQDGVDHAAKRHRGTRARTTGSTPRGGWRTGPSAPSVRARPARRMRPAAGTTEAIHPTPGSSCTPRLRQPGALPKKHTRRGRRVTPRMAPD
jgi:hypothetical protein